MKSIAVVLLMCVGLTVKAQTYRTEVYVNALSFFNHDLTLGVNLYRGDHAYGLQFGQQAAPISDPDQFSTHVLFEYRYYFNKDAQKSGWMMMPHVRGAYQSNRDAGDYDPLFSYTFDYDRWTVNFGASAGYQLATNSAWVFGFWAGGGINLFEDIKTNRPVSSIAHANVSRLWEMRLGLSAGYRF